MEKAALLLAHVAATVVITIYLNMHAILINVWVYNILYVHTAGLACTHLNKPPRICEQFALATLQ